MTIKKISIFLLLIIVILIIFCNILTLKNSFGEYFETQVNQDEQKYDDALEKRIAEVKYEAPRFDAEVMLNTNKPFRPPQYDGRGWWANVINCEDNGSLGIYCKPRNKWIWPY